MKKDFRPFAALIALAFVISSCASPAGIEATQPSSSEQVGTVVAMTLQALMPTVCLKRPQMCLKQPQVCFRIVCIFLAGIASHSASFIVCSAMAKQ